VTKKLSQNALIGEAIFLLRGSQRKKLIEGNVFDRGVEALERYSLQNSFPLTPTLSSRRGSFGIVSKPARPVNPQEALSQRLSRSRATPTPYRA